MLGFAIILNPYKWRIKYYQMGNMYRLDILFLSFEVGPA